MDFQTIIVGAGVIGLAIARELSTAGLSVLVVEKCPAAGTATSSRNSEVIHAGLYYPTGSLKARLCLEGRNLLYEYCAAAGVATRQLGKLIVAAESKDESKLASIFDLAVANGVDNLQWLSPNDVTKLEPAVRCTGALLSPSTGIVDARAFMLALQADAERRETTFSFNTLFRGAEKRGDLLRVITADTAGIETTVTCKIIINCAGLGAQAAAQSVEGLRLESLPPKHFAKGSYCSVSGRSPFNHLIYPVPVPGALGIHATIDMAGQVRLGPDIEWIDDLDYSLSNVSAEKFASAAEHYWPGVRDRVVTPSYCGIRPKINGPNSPAADFCIQDFSDHGVPGLINLFGIESPGLTASLAIAKHVLGQVSNSS